MPANHPYRPLVGAGLMATVLTSGCATITAPLEPVATTESVLALEPQIAEFVLVARYGRYTLVEHVPEPAQRDLMQQVVEVTIPQQFDTHVGDAMRHVLRRTGYRLCETEEAASLYALPLPAAHLRLGPLTLRDALLVLAGPAWKLAVDDAERQVCFARNGASLTNGSAPVSNAESEQTQEFRP